MPCLFCQQDGGTLQLHQFETLEDDKTLRKMTELMARIEGGNLAALETKYHLKCLTALCNCYRSFKGKVSVQMPSANSSATGNEFKDHKLFTLCRKKLLGFDLCISGHLKGSVVRFLQIQHTYQSTVVYINTIMCNN